MTMTKQIHTAASGIPNLTWFNLRNVSPPNINMSSLLHSRKSLLMKRNSFMDFRDIWPFGPGLSDSNDFFTNM
jgi:hypothetical protein